jgi:hypothetical protein
MAVLSKTPIFKRTVCTGCTATWGHVLFPTRLLLTAPHREALVLYLKKGTQPLYRKLSRCIASLWNFEECKGKHLAFQPLSFLHSRPSPGRLLSSLPGIYAACQPPRAVV